MTARSEGEIIVPILEAAMTGATKYRIVKQSGLTYKQVRIYLELLTTQNLILEPKRHFYKITESGIIFLRKTSELNELIAPIKPLIRNR